MECHMKIGDSAVTMRLACGEPIKDACWTNNPRQVTCTKCLRTQEQELVNAQ